MAQLLNDAASIGMLDRALARAVELGEPPDRPLVSAWCCLAAVASHHGDLDTANRAATAAAQAAAVSGDPSLVSLARDLDGHVASNSGDHARAYRAHAAGVEDARRAGDRYDLVHVLVAAADSLLNLGRPTEAMALVDEAFELVGELDPVQTLSAVLVGRGAVLTALGRVASARGCLREVVRLGLGRYPDQMVMADGLYLLAVGAAMERVDDVAARLWGATDAIYRDEGANHEFRQLAQFVACGPRRVAGWARRPSTEPLLPGAQHPRASPPTPPKVSSGDSHVRRRRARACAGDQTHPPGFPEPVKRGLRGSRESSPNAVPTTKEET